MTMGLSNWLITIKEKLNFHFENSQNRIGRKKGEKEKERKKKKTFSSFF
jgi:hypothetical protein